MISSDLKRIVMEACVLVAFGALCGLTLNHQLVMDAFSGQLVSSSRSDSSVVSSSAQESVQTVFPLPVLIDEVQQVVASGGLLVDARTPELYALGHIEGAVSLPLVELDIELQAFLSRVAKDQTLMIYCSGFGCPDSFDMGVKLIEEGYLDVRVFEGGYPEWRDAGLPVIEARQ